MAALCWQAANASGIVLQGVMIQSLIVMRNDNYAAPAWQGWLLVVAVAAVCVFCNIYLEKILPQINNAAMYVHVGGFIATIAVLWALAPHVSAKEALLTFENEGGWSSTGLALMVGQLTVVFALGGMRLPFHSLTRRSLTRSRFRRSCSHERRVTQRWHNSSSSHVLDDHDQRHYRLHRHHFLHLRHSKRRRRCERPVWLFDDLCLHTCWRH